MATDIHRGLDLDRRRKHDALEFTLFFAVCFPVFLVAAAGERILQPSRPAKSILAQALESTRNAISYAFMG